ncbi:hypothetical protein ACFL27_14410 [candidate division CSSED10-310 bacterium]|uniref:Uncharacterized protein n=1 Tax=candidate division CSSED10-310 bacterium TaxID=2855610 RepID=A0ABV6YYW2_UNCC1
MLNKKQLIVIIVLTVIFLVIILSWTLLQEKPKPVIVHALDLSATVTLLKNEYVSDNLIQVDYQWQTGPKWAVPAGNILLFVHLQDDDGQRLCQDDHMPPVPIKNWTPDQTYTYSRMMYIPLTLLKKKITLLTGLYNQDNDLDCYAFQGLKQYNRYHRYLGGEFILMPSDMEYSEAIVKYTRGWYDPELNKQGEIMWRWMKDKAECKLLNPKSDAFLYIDAWIPNKYFQKPAAIKITIAEKEMELPPLENDFLHTILPVSAAQLGDSEFVLLTLDTDQTFVPAKEGYSIDARELGIMVKKILFRAK